MKVGEVPGNRLLQLLKGSDCAEFPTLSPVELRARDVLHEPGSLALHAYFPVTAVVSLVSTMESGASTEVAMVGREGVLGLFGVLGGVEGPVSPVVQIGGSALRTTTAGVRAARVACPAFRNTLDVYTTARLIQVAQTAACSRLHSVDERLARWILSVHDRIDGDRFTLSQESIAQALGVHRPTVTTALQRFQERGVIGHDGRALVITDRAGLESLACECHRIVHDEFERMLRGRVMHPTAPKGAGVAVPAGVREGEGTAALEAVREIAGRLLLTSIREQEAREAAVAEATRDRDRALATVARELRPPLQGILRWCSVLIEAGDERTAPGVREIERAALAGLQRIDEVFDSGRIAAQDPPRTPGGGAIT